MGYRPLPGAGEGLRHQGGGDVEIHRAGDELPLVQDAVNPHHLHVDGDAGVPDLLPPDKVLLQIEQALPVGRAPVGVEVPLVVEVPERHGDGVAHMEGVAVVPGAVDHADRALERNVLLRDPAAIDEMGLHEGPGGGGALHAVGEVDSGGVLVLVVELHLLREPGQGGGAEVRLLPRGHGAVPGAILCQGLELQDRGLLDLLTIGLYDPAAADAGLAHGQGAPEEVAPSGLHPLGHLRQVHVLQALVLLCSGDVLPVVREDVAGVAVILGVDEGDEGALPDHVHVPQVGAHQHLVHQEVELVVPLQVAHTVVGLDHALEGPVKEYIFKIVVGGLHR